ncbi:MAG: T9SS type A sorting domain-containing protein [Bacteroidota bacterium]
MKRIILIIWLMGSLISTYAQLNIESGSQLVVDGSVNIVLDNINWVQDGDFIPGQSKVILRGNQAQQLHASLLRFYQLELDKVGDSLRIMGPMVVEDSLFFLQGMLDLRGMAIDLLNSGTLYNESESSRILTSLPNGAVFRTAILNAPAGANPGNLGVVISSAANLGQTSLIRGHDAAIFPGGETVKRVFNLNPTNNSGLNASLRFNYFDGELNSLPESDLLLFQSNDMGITWEPAGASNSSTSSNYVEISGVDSLSTWTLATFATFPVEWLDFTATPNEAQVVCQWSTASETNSDYFQLQRSTDGAVFEDIVQVKAAGNSQQTRHYEGIDRSPLSGRSYYRVKQFDQDGSSDVSQMVEVFYRPDFSAMLYPNPSRELTNLVLQNNHAKTYSFEVTDSRGKTCQSFTKHLTEGLHEIPLDLTPLSRGIYHLSIGGNKMPVHLSLMVR